MVLRRWSASNFKSLKNKVELDLSPLTLLVGANSSGKSSIIQSLLLIKQTIAYGSSGNPLLLNGPLARLGDFSDVKNAKSPSRSFGVSFNFDVSLEDARRLNRGLPFLTTVSRQINNIEVEFEVGRDTKEPNNAIANQPFLRNSVLGVTYTREGRLEKSEIRVKRKRQIEDQNAIEYLRLRRGAQLTEFGIDRISSDLIEEASTNRPSMHIHGGRTSYFAPDAILVSFDAKVKFAKEAAEYLTGPASLLNIEPSSNKSLYLDASRAAIAQWIAEDEFEDHMEDELNRASSFSQMREAIKPVLDQYRPAPRGLLPSGLLRSLSSSPGNSEKLQELKESIASAIISSREEDISFQYAEPSTLSTAHRHLADFFRNRVRYLGPIRDAPKPLYGLQPLPDPTDVGYMGEHTAAVYDLNKGSLVQSVTPPSGKEAAGAISRVTLEQAVTDWLSYMGVISGVATHDRGKFGRELQVQTEGLAKYHDLTNVGVGVSQVLPIVVACLLAPRNSVIVLEQPELHLHPKVQLRLADFLIAITRTSKQFIVETHSEYLIYRIRRRIAEAESQKESDLVSLYFVEREAGVTGVRKVGINQFGAFADWPKDFFDQASTEAEYIIRAAAQKQIKSRDA